jgi:hypothetical protein
MLDEDPSLEHTTLEGVPFVRLSAEFGDSPVWAWEPVDYAELGLSEDLERRLRAWAAAAEDAPSTDAGDAPERAAQRLRAEGILLAQLLAEHLGSPLAVQFRAANPSTAWEDDGGRRATGESGPWADDGSMARTSLADPEIFHVDTFPARPAATRRIAWRLRHPFEVPGLGE